MNNGINKASEAADQILLSLAAEFTYTYRVSLPHAENIEPGGAGE